jgi:hypothetical protein
MLTKVEKILAAQRILGSRDVGHKATCQAYEAIGKRNETRLLKTTCCDSDQLNMESNPGLLLNLDPDVSF